MTPRPFRLLTELPRSDLGIGLFYLVFGAIIQLAGMNILGSFAVNLVPNVMLWPVVLLLGCIGVVLRSSRTTVMIVVCGIAALLALLTGAGVICLLFVFEIIFSGVLYGSQRLSRATQLSSVLLSVVIVIWAAVNTADLQAVLAFALQSVVVFLTPMWWASNVRSQREIADAEQQRATQTALLMEQERQLAGLDTQLAIAAERGKMARDLHDVIAGRLSAIALQSEAALRSSDPSLRAEVIRTSRQTSLQALADMRQMIEVLHTVETEPDPVQSAGAADIAVELTNLAETTRALGTEIRLSIGEVPEISAVSANTLYRICQEALTNAAKHAAGNTVEVDLALIDEEIVLRISNSFPAGPTGTGHGLRNMAFRATELGGQFSASPVRDRWLLEARLPR